MPRYFFNVHDGHSSLDQDGTELRDQDEARVMALRLSGEILRDEAERMALGDTWRLEVLDEAAASIIRLRVSLDAPDRR